MYSLLKLLILIQDWLQYLHGVIIEVLQIWFQTLPLKLLAQSSQWIFISGIVFLMERLKSFEGF